MDEKQTFCLEGRHFSQTLNQDVHEKLNPKTKKLVKILKGTCSFCGRNKSQIFTESRTIETKWQNFQKSAECKKNHSSPMLNLTWCILNNKGSFLKVHDMWVNLSFRSKRMIQLKSWKNVLNVKLQMIETFKKDEIRKDGVYRHCINCREVFFLKNLVKFKKDYWSK